MQKPYEAMSNKAQVPYMVVTVFIVLGLLLGFPLAFLPSRTETTHAMTLDLCQRNHSCKGEARSGRSQNSSIKQLRLTDKTDWKKASKSSPSAALLRNHRAKRPCLDDSFLPDQLPKGKYLFAVNLHNSEHVVAHMIAQFMKLVRTTQDKQNMFISIFESGSTDLTIEHLKLFKDVLQEIGMPHRIVAGSPQKWTPGSPAFDRISFLASVRNRALEPLWSSSDRGKPPPPPAWFEEMHLPEGGFPADRVVFINDVFVCASDIIRLAQHDADVACGMDFMKSADNKLQFWDTWVTRDIRGSLINLGGPTFTNDEYSQKRLEAGLPVPMYSCWNGMVVMRAEPFRRGLRMRSHAAGECAASECSIMADDFWRLGYGRVVMDPGVRVVYPAYLEHDFLYGFEGGFKIPAASWQAVIAAGPITWEEVKRPENITCCELLPGEQHVHWETCFDDFNPFATNFTTAAIQTKFAVSLQGARFNAGDKNHTTDKGDKANVVS